MARTRAAKPAALEASPAAVGKLLAETRWRGMVERAGRLGSVDSRVARRARREERQAWVRFEEAISSGLLLRVRVSGPV
jgi:hypothetical protein